MSTSQSAALAPRPSFLILVAVSTIGPMALNLFMPSMPGLQQYFGISYATAQLTLTLYLIGLACSTLIYGPMSDRHGRRPMLLAGLALFVVASLAAAVAPTIELLIAARLVQAVGGAAGIVLARAMIRDVYSREKSASMMAYVTMAFVVAPMVAPVIGGWLETVSGWRAGFWLLGLLGAVVLAAAWKFAPETHHARNTGGGTNLVTGAIRLFSLPAFRSYTGTLSLASAVFFSFLSGAPQVMVDVLHRTPMEYGLWFALISAGYMAGNFLCGRYTERIGLDRTMLIGCIITLVGGVLCLAAAVGGALTPATLFLPMVFAAFGNGLTLPNGNAGAISAAPGLTGAAAGWAGFSQMIVGAGASQFVGSLQASFPAALFWFMAIASALALACHVFSSRAAAIN